MKGLKKLCALLLCAATVLTALPLPSSAEEKANDIIYENDFSDTASLTSDFTGDMENYSIADGALISDGAGSGKLVIVNDISMPDNHKYSVSVTPESTDNASAGWSGGLVFGYNDGTYYHLRLDEGITGGAAQRTVQLLQLGAGASLETQLPYRKL